VKHALTLVPKPDDTQTTRVGGGMSGVRTDVAERETVSRGARATQESWPTDDEPESELPVPEGTLLAGKYTVQGTFAEGGMGIICSGRHVQLEQPVAIKFLRRALSGRPSIVERFLNEARALAALRGEHIVRVIDVGQLESGRPYLVMEHLDGTNLEELLERSGALSIETAVNYALQVCEALGEAHALGIVHRDIKPENLFLWSGGPATDSIKVLDFGLAKQLGASRALGVTGPQDSVGSPCYMSPEQVSSPQLVDARTDIWSLGVVLYRLLVDVLPFEGDNLVQALSHILNATPVPLTEVSPTLDADLNAIVMRCLAKAPADRYQTAAEVAAALRSYLTARLQPPAVAQPVPVESVPPAELRAPRPRAVWPWVCLALLTLLLGALYAANRSGAIQLRDVPEGWLTPATSR
jgi:eukaryotic-like serine/threonine-protein kinase